MCSRRFHPDEQTRTLIKRAAIVHLHKMGAIGAHEFPRLAALHVDDVLDRLFLHCSKIRLRVDDDRVIEILPRPNLRSTH